jgi:hypothetical protein
MNILYKKCGKGHVNKYHEGEMEPEVCERCGLPLRAEEFQFNESVIETTTDANPDYETVREIRGELKTNVQRSKSRFSLISESKKIIIDIPDDAEQMILGRQGLGASEHLWGANISRKHLLLTSKLGGIFIEDPGSTNGTLLNEERLEVNKPSFITEGAVVVLDAVIRDIELKLVKNIL